MSLQAHTALFAPMRLQLVLGDLSSQWAADIHTTYDNVAANVVFPADAGCIFIDGMRVPNTTSFSTHLGATLGIVSNASAGGMIAARIFAADPIANYTPVVDVRFDSPHSSGAARLVAYLYRGHNRTLFPPSSRVGVIFGAAETGGDPSRIAAVIEAVANATVEQTWVGGVWNVRVTPQQGAPAGLRSTLESTLNVSGRSVIQRRVNGSDYVPRLFRVWNGTFAIDVVPPWL